MDACLAHNTADRLGDITVPTLVIHAAKDMVTSPRTTLPIEQGIPDAEGVMMKGHGHTWFAGKDQKIEFCNILFSFLDKH
ncbi:MAG: hypothetical protein CM1200mP18_04980 [Gammaproteobacteria bacterium]|nr:MAG: hypothetical protein CM1200mP18_04980 [Gammaproteobacteria bacterium]